MARTQTSERHRDGQAALALIVGPLIRHAWSRLLDPHDLKGSAPKLTATVEAIVAQYGRGSSAAALNSYRLQRREAGILGRPSLRMPPLPTHDAVTATVEHVLTPLYGPTDPQALDVAEQALESSVERLVLDQGRTAIIHAVQSDKAAKGWARVTEDRPCYFCAMLASRGAVYKTRETAEFKAHNRCRCHVEPVFNAYEPTAETRQWMADYRRLKDEHDGHLSLIEWRRAFEGRDGTDRPPLG